MRFKKKEFLKEKFKYRTKVVPVPTLARFFEKENETGPDEIPSWEVRGLEGIELGHAKVRSSNGDTMLAAIEAMIGGNRVEKAEAFRVLFGLKGIPVNDALHIEILVTGSVSPECNLDMALKLYKTHPGVIDMLAREIKDLTGLGMLPGKPEVSGPPIQASETV